MQKAHAAHRQKSKSPLKVIIIFFVIIVALYAAVGIYYSGHFFNNTYINSCDVSGMTVEQAKSILRDKASSYALVLEESNESYEKIYGSDIDLHMDITDDFDSMLKNQNGFGWILNIFKENQYIADESMVSYSYNDDMLNDRIDNLECINPEYPIEAKNAELILMDGEFKIISEDIGNVAHRDKLESEIRVCIESQITTLNLTDAGIYDVPSVFSDDPKLIAKKDLCDGLKAMTIDLIFGYADEHIDVQTFINWVDAVEDGESYSLVANEDAIKAYVDILSEKYNTSGKPKTFAATRGEVVEILYGDYGWKLDSAYAAEKLAEMVLAQQTVKIDLTDHSETSNEWWIQTAVGYDANGNDYYGTTYAEVSISEQHMWMYQDGVLALETDVVTGNPTLGNDTPQGAFRIRSMQEDAILRGPGYETPVDYWMVFADDVGFHDATWQAAFGGDLYYSVGSHGCVNMPLEEAEKLYGLIYVGMPVFVYY